MTNANILLIPKRVIEKIGIFHKGYIHGCADYDYSLTAQRENIPTFTTAHICGKCEFDHMDSKSEIDRLISMSFNERKNTSYIRHILTKIIFFSSKGTYPKGIFFVGY